MHSTLIGCLEPEDIYILEEQPKLEVLVVAPRSVNGTYGNNVDRHWHFKTMNESHRIKVDILEFEASITVKNCGKD